MRVCVRCRSVYPPGTRFCGIDGQELTDFKEDPLLGQTVDRYEVVSLLGRGSFASVYKAIHTQLRSEQAIKILHGNLGADAMFVERFRREAQVVSRIRSPYVVSVIDFGTSDKGLTYLVMELCTGATLDRLIPKGDPFTAERAARFTAQIASGLGAAHRMGFVHRDVKPGNIAVEVDEGGKERAKLLDFGIVRTPEIEGSDKLTKQGSVIGTPAYMAPEQADGRDTTAQADLYSLGVVLYEMLAGHKPFKGKVAELFYQHHHSPPPPLSISGPIAELCLQLLEKEPAHRPKDAAEVSTRARAIEVALRGGDPSIDPAEDLLTTPALAIPSLSHPGSGLTGLAAPESQTAPSLFSSSHGTHNQPRSRMPTLLIAGGLGLLALTAAALSMRETPVQSVTVPAPKPLVELEQQLTKTLEHRGLTFVDLKSLPDTALAYDRWEAARSKEDTEARSALDALIEAAPKAQIPEVLLMNRLDSFDPLLAALGERQSGPAFEALKADYLDLYRLVRSAAAPAEREAAARATLAFRHRLTLPAVAAPTE